MRFCGFTFAACLACQSTTEPGGHLFPEHHAVAAESDILALGVTGPVRVIAGKRMQEVAIKEWFVGQATAQSSDLLFPLHHSGPYGFRERHSGELVFVAARLGAFLDAPVGHKRHPLTGDVLATGIQWAPWRVSDDDQVYRADDSHIGSLSFVSKALKRSVQENLPRIEIGQGSDGGRCVPVRVIGPDCIDASKMIKLVDELKGSGVLGDEAVYTPGAPMHGAYYVIEVRTAQWLGRAKLCGPLPAWPEFEALWDLVLLAE